MMNGMMRAKRRVRESVEKAALQKGQRFTEEGGDRKSLTMWAEPLSLLSRQPLNRRSQGISMSRLYKANQRKELMRGGSGSRQVMVDTDWRVAVSVRSTMRGHYAPLEFCSNPETYLTSV